MRIHPPRRNFWANNPHWARWRWTRPYRWATWAAVTAWFPWGSSWGSYSYYDYGGNVEYRDNYVYVEDEQVCTAEEYADQAVALAGTGAEALDAAVSQDADVEWMTLGVFALVHEEQDDPTMYLQLAVSKDGMISGTYYNSVSDETLPIQGSVDKDSQRAAWSAGDNSNTVMETGVYNLTQDETSVLIHFGDQEQQQWLMVRLEDPESEQETGGNP